jgi:hypothetical protein
VQGADPEAAIDDLLDRRVAEHLREHRARERQWASLRPRRVDAQLADLTLDRTPAERDRAQKAVVDAKESVEPAVARATYTCSPPVKAARSPSASMGSSSV